MKTRIFTLLVAFLTMVGNAVWGQTTYKVSFDAAIPEGFISETIDGIAGDTWSLKDAFIISINGEEQELKENDFKDGFSVEPGSTVSLALKEKSGMSPTVYAGYNIVSFNIEEGTNLTSVTNSSFIMPEGDVTIKNIVFDRKVFSFKIRFPEDNVYMGGYIDEIEGLEVYYENMDGEIITEAVYREKVRLIIKPKTGYKIESLAKVSRTLRNHEWGENFTSFSTQDVTKQLQYNSEEGYYYEEFLMPQTVVATYVYAADTSDGENPDGPVTKVVPIDYNLTATTDGNGTITFGEEGTQTTANYQKQVQVNVTPNEGYHVVRSSLYYTIEGSDEQIPIMMTDGTYSFTMPAANVTVHAEFAEGAEQTYLVSIADNIEHGTISAEPTEATSGTTINLTVTPEEGYQLQTLYYIANGKTEQTPIAGTSFEMPASDVTIYATFKDISTDPDDDNPGGIVPDAPKYYNIYEEEICEGVTVEFSRDVVKEGQSVLVTVKVDEEFDATKMTLKFKRSLFGYWEDLTLTPTENPNEYIIENIYTDIYVRVEGAVPTGIEDIEGAKVYTKDGSIYVYTPAEEQVQIISVSGAIVKNETQVGLKQYTGLQRGIYIIGIGEARFKVRL